MTILITRMSFNCFSKIAKATCFGWQVLRIRTGVQQQKTTHMAAACKTLFSRSQRVA